MPDEVGPPNGVTTPNRLCASASNASLQPAKRVRTSRYLLARARAAMWSRMTRAVSRASSDQSASRDATRLAWLRRITPSSSTLRPLAASVAPVVVMSTIISAVPTAGAPPGGAAPFARGGAAPPRGGEKVGGRGVYFVGAPPRPVLLGRKT